MSPHFEVLYTMNDKNQDNSDVTSKLYSLPLKKNVETLHLETQLMSNNLNARRNS